MPFTISDKDALLRQKSTFLDGCVFAVQLKDYIYRWP